MKDLSRKDFEVGQTIWLRRISSARRNFHISLVHSAVVTKIGKRFLYVRHPGKNYDTVFDMKNGYKAKDVYGQPEFVLHLSREDAVEEVEKGKLQQRIDAYVRQHYRLPLSLDKLRIIANAMGVGVTKEELEAECGQEEV